MMIVSELRSDAGSIKHFAATAGIAERLDGIMSHIVWSLKKAVQPVDAEER